MYSHGLKHLKTRSIHPKENHYQGPNRCFHMSDLPAIHTNFVLFSDLSNSGAILNQNPWQTQKLSCFFQKLMENTKNKLILAVLRPFQVTSRAGRKPGNSRTHYARARVARSDHKALREARAGDARKRFCELLRGL
jgi:hypothetical protein